MSPDRVGALVHTHAPHSGAALFLASLICALGAIAAVAARCAYTRSIDQLPTNWVVTAAALAAPVPTFLLLLVIPIDEDLSRTVFHDPVVVMLAGLYGLAAAFREIRALASKAYKGKGGNSGT